MICLKCQQSEVDPNSGKKWCVSCRKVARQILDDWRLTHPKHLYSGRSYESRQVALNELGFTSYKAYLESALWRRVRSKVYAVKGNYCYLCNEPANAVHHNRYHKNDLTGKTLRNLFPICGKCHESIEFSKRKHKKMPLHHAKAEFIRNSNHLSSLLLNHDAE